MSSNKQIKVEAPENTTFSDPDATGKHISNLESFLNLVDRVRNTRIASLLNGLTKIIILVLTILLIRFLVNPRPTIEYFLNLQTLIQDEQHTELIDLRLKNSPQINSYLKQLRLESEMNRAFIMEFHNGNNNVANLPFYYGDMTYESVSDGITVTGENTNLSLTRFDFPLKISQDGFFFGTVEEIQEIDPLFADRVRSIGSTYLAILPLYDHSDRVMGILGVSYNGDSSEINNKKILALLGVYSSKIEPLISARPDSKLK